MANGDKKARRQQTLSVDLGGKLLGEVETMRRVLQDAAGCGQTISRGDVVRLALMRLRLAMHAHDAEDPVQSIKAMILWESMVAELRLLAICPDWLVPGAADRPTGTRAKPKKGGKK